MSRVVRHERCPKCAKLGRDKHGDNLVLYSDSGEHCFSCGYHKSSSTKRLLALGSQYSPVEEIKDDTPIYPLPYDVEGSIPAVCLSWLGKYGLGYKDVVENSILWSQSKQLLIFPFDNAWQGRYFGVNTAYPKWYSQGKLEDIFFIRGSNEERNIILVEDVVSAIVLGNSGITSLCLFGSYLAPNRLSRLYSMGFRRVSFWLDWDKRESALKQATRARMYGFETGTIITELDPKEYSKEEIKNIFNKILDKPLK